LRHWSLLFILAVVFGIGAFAYAPFSPDWWLPNPATEPVGVVADAARRIDGLFLAVLGLSGFGFVVAWAATIRPRRGGLGREAAWAVVPGGILLFLACHQMNAWAVAERRAIAPPESPLAEATARRFQWSFAYPGPDGLIGTADDLAVDGELHLVRGESALVHLKSADVFHAFFLPQLRVKRDAAPGATVPLRLEIDRAGRYELACAELCGWGHYRMRGVVVVHETRAGFETWLAARVAERDRDRADDGPTESFLTVPEFGAAVRDKRSSLLAGEDRPRGGQMRGTTRETTVGLRGSPSGKP